MSELLFDFTRDGVYLSDCTHVLGPLRRTLEELAHKGLLASSVESLQKLGYHYNRAAEPGTELMAFVAPLIQSLLDECKNPSAFVVHHSYAASTSDESPLTIGNSWRAPGTFRLLCSAVLRSIMCRIGVPTRADVQD